MLNSTINSPQPRLPSLKTISCDMDVGEKRRKMKDEVSKILYTYID